MNAANSFTAITVTHGVRGDIVHLKENRTGTFNWDNFLVFFWIAPGAKTPVSCFFLMFSQY
jgi:hypothetical protein